MSAAIPQPPPRYLRTPEAARFLGLSGRTLEKHRTYGTGPAIPSSAGASSTASKICRPGSNGARKASTSDPGVGEVLPAKRHPQRLAGLSPARHAADRPAAPLMSTRHRPGSEREQLELFRTLPGDLAPRDAQDLMAYPFFSLAKSHRSTPIDFRSGDVAIRVEAVPEHGMATIWDADVLIWAAPRSSRRATPACARRA